MEIPLSRLYPPGTKVCVVFECEVIGYSETSLLLLQLPDGGTIYSSCGELVRRRPLESSVNQPNAEAE